MLTVFFSERRELDHRDTGLLSALDLSNILKLGLNSVGMNAQASGNSPWVGADGAFTNTFHNQYTQDIVLVIWGPAGSWVNAIRPQITVSIPTNSSKTISFPIGWSGAWAPIYPDSKLINGQISDTWGEGTFSPPYSVVDVSREVNMNGRSMKIVGPTCTTDMNTCVFKCVAGGGNSCLEQYELLNCATGSQPGANYGMYGGMPSGGCGGMGSSANLQTYLGYTS